VITRATLEAGETVVAAARSPEAMEEVFSESNRAHVLALDITDV